MTSAALIGAAAGSVLMRIGSDRRFMQSRRGNVQRESKCLHTHPERNDEILSRDFGRMSRAHAVDWSHESSPVDFLHLVTDGKVSAGVRRLKRHFLTRKRTRSDHRRPACGSMHPRLLRTLHAQPSSSRAALRDRLSSPTSPQPENPPLPSPPPTHQSPSASPQSSCARQRAQPSQATTSTADAPLPQP